MTIYYLQETHFIYDSLNRLKVKRWEKIHHANINQKKAGVAMLILSRLGTEKKITRRALCYDKRVNPSRRHNNINVYAPKNRDAKYVN